eukprot:TRINITY_DN423_c0_g1_i1.p1 TRINITY_DN423_c0_g1~~TRINITY_DN423_c0_g1_i1.p1  ORF type:complete len:215 (+),score=63.64 TRINITY_DN423_c0_g1_i1:125-769(+)
MSAENIGKIHGMKMSTCVQRSLVTAATHGKTFTLVNVDLMKGEHKQPAHLALQPFGQVPVYVDTDGTTLYESRAIARYIDVKYGGGKLTQASNPKKFGIIEQWASVEGSHWDPSVSGITRELVFAPMFGGKPDEAKVDELKKKFVGVLAVYEARLSANKYLAGDELSIADLFHIPYGAHVLKVAGDVFDNAPKTKAWLEGLIALPAWQTTLAFN